MVVVYFGGVESEELSVRIIEKYTLRHYPVPDLYGEKSHTNTP